MNFCQSDISINDIFQTIYKDDLNKQKWIVGIYGEFSCNSNLKCIENIKCNNCSLNYFYIDSQNIPNLICKLCKIIKFRCIVCNKISIVKLYDVYFRIFCCSKCDNQLLKEYNNNYNFVDEDTKNEICQEIFTSSYVENRSHL